MRKLRDLKLSDDAIQHLEEIERQTEELRQACLKKYWFPYSFRTGKDLIFDDVFNTPDKE